MASTAIHADRDVIPVKSKAFDKGRFAGAGRAGNTEGRRRSPSTAGDGLDEPLGLQ